MTTRTIRMTKIRAILKFAQVETHIRAIAQASRTSRTAVENALQRVSERGMTVQQAAMLDDNSLREVIYPSRRTGERERSDDFQKRLPMMLKELGKKHMTRQLLWEEYRQENPGGYAYSRFCDYLRDEIKPEEVYLGQEYGYGQQLFIDYAGEGHYYIDGTSGEEVKVNLFAAILPASQFTFCEFTPAQRMEDWICATENACREIGGVPGSIVADCAKSVVKKADWYESEIQVQFERFADYYGTVVTPARPGHPRDKALVENVINNIYRWVYPRLARKNSYSLAELNAALKTLMEQFNKRTMRQYQCSRSELFETCERATLQPIPAQPYEFKHYLPPKKAQFNNHVWFPVDKHYYSIPYRFIGRMCSIFYNSTIIEVFCDNARIAMHMRDRTLKTRHTTIEEHLCPSHQAFVKWTPERFQLWARESGPNVERLILKLLERARHPVHAYKTCMGLMRMRKPFGDMRFDRACEMVLEFDKTSIKRVESILEKGIDLVESHQRTLPGLSLQHENIRYTNNNKESIT